MKHVESGIDIDLIFGGLPFEQTAIDNSQIHDLEGVKVRLPQVEDLLIMKAVARRPKDLLDIEGLLEAHPQANVEVLRQWVREFCDAMSMSEMVIEFEKLLAQRKTKPEIEPASKPERALKLKAKSRPRSKREYSHSDAMDWAKTRYTALEPATNIVPRNGL